MTYLKVSYMANRKQQ